MASDFLSEIHPSSTKPRDENGSGKSLPVLPVRDTVLFPHAVLPLTVGRESSIQLIQSLGERRPSWSSPSATRAWMRLSRAICTTYGTLATVHKVVKMPNQSLFVFTEGTERVQAGHVRPDRALHDRRGRDRRRDRSAERLAEIEALVRNVLSAVPADRLRVADAVRRAADHRHQHRRARPAGRLRRLVAAVPHHDDKQELLETPDVTARLERSTSTWPRRSKCSSFATRSRPRCRTRSSSRSATTICASR